MLGAKATHPVMIIPQSKNRIDLGVEHHFVGVPPGSFRVLHQVTPGNNPAIGIHDHGAAGLANFDLVQKSTQLIERDIGGEHHFMPIIAPEAERAGHDKLLIRREQVRLRPLNGVFACRILVPRAGAGVIRIGGHIILPHLLPCRIVQRVLENLFTVRPT